MEWFQHSTGSHDDPDISDAEDLFGDAGYNVFFKTLEIYGREFNKLDDEGFLRISRGFLRKKLRKSSGKVEQILNFFSERKRILTKIDGDYYIIQIPKYLELSSNWTKRKATKSTPAPTEAPTEAPTAKEEEEEKEKKKNKKNKQKRDALSPTGSEKMFLNYLLSQIDVSGNGIKKHQKKIIEFFNHRMRMPKAKQYKTEKGIDGLIRDCVRCKERYSDLDECLDITMERDWLTPDPEYLTGKVREASISPQSKALTPDEINRLVTDDE